NVRTTPLMWRLSHTCRRACMTIGAWRAAVAASAALALVVAGCGSSSNDNSSSTPKAGSAPAGSSAKKGGGLKGRYAADVDFMDPRAPYYQYGFLVAYATQRPLYSYKQDDATTPPPDLAAGRTHTLRE